MCAKVTTSFTIATHSWQDEDEESLQYSLYAFPTEKVTLNVVDISRSLFQQLASEVIMLP